VRRTGYGDRVWFQADDKSAYSMPIQWTSLHVPDAFELASSGRAWFRHDDLATLAELISEIRQRVNDDTEEA
jgi:hypothetical protein